MANSNPTSDDDAVVDGCSERTLPNYESVDMPAKTPTEYNTDERRAELLQLVRQAGHPRAIN